MTPCLIHTKPVVCVDITQRFKKHDFVYFGITSADANKLKQTLKTAVPSDTTANNVTSSGDTTQNDDILAHDVAFRKRNCELGLSKAYARHYRCKGSSGFVSLFTNNLVGFTCMRECLACRFG